MKGSIVNRTDRTGNDRGKSKMSPNLSSIAANGNQEVGTDGYLVQLEATTIAETQIVQVET